MRDSIEVTWVHRDKLPMEHGRNLFKLSEALTQDSPDNVHGAEELLKDADVYLKKDNPDAGAALASGEEAFDHRINIAWR